MNEGVTKDLNMLLADYQVLYQKLRNYHWNVAGPMFFGLHQKFEELYDDAALKVDALAERILATGGKPVSTMKEQLALARLHEDPSVPEAQAMVRNVQQDLEQLNMTLRELATKADRAGDTATTNLVEGFADGQEKAAWMLRAFLTA